MRSNTELSGYEQILNVSKRLFFEQGFDKTSLRDISTECGIAHPSIFYHFKSKKQILATIMERFSKLWQERIAGLDPDIDYLEMEILTTILSLRYADDDPRYGRILCDACHNGAADSLLTGWSQEYYQDLVTYDVDIPQVALDEIVFSVMMNIFARIWDIRSDGKVTITYDDALELTLESFRRILGIERDAFAKARATADDLAGGIDYRDIPFFTDEYVIRR